LGVLSWKRTFGGTGWDEARSVSITSDSGYVISGFQNYDSPYSDVFLIRFESDTSGCHAINLPQEYYLFQNFPNPFNNQTVIRYYVPSTSEIKLEIFNVLGQKVKTLLDEKKEEGYYRTSWDGINDAGAQVGTGICFYRFSSGNFAKASKMVLVR
jgi:hypothetical protein